MNTSFRPSCSRRWLMLAALLWLGATHGFAQPAEGTVPLLDEEPLEAVAPRVRPLALDTTSATDDHSINKPTGWWFYSGLSAAQVSDRLDTNNARLTGLEVSSIVGGAPRFTVRMVANSGAYAASGWWWYYGLTSAQITTHLNANNARLIDLEPYDAGNGALRYAVIMVRNTGSAARSWWWYHGKTTAQIAALLGGRRLIDLDSYRINGVTRYTAVMVANTGGDQKAWEWWYGQTLAGVNARVAAFNGRVVKIDRRSSDGRYNVVLVKNTGSNNTAWWHWYGFSSSSALVNYANQLAARPVDVITWVSGGQRRYAAAFIDNANASTRRVRSAFGETFLDASGNPTRGIFEAYLKRAGGSVHVNLNATRRAETASSFKSVHLLHAMRRVAAGSDSLGSAFTYYEYDPAKGKNACPNPSLEIVANRRTNYDLETGLDQMMSISDNRTTRGTVIRYGGFAPFNLTASTLGLSSTTLRHNIGCSYRNLANGKYEPDTRRNDTSARDLARIYEGVWTSTLLSNANSARDEFLESTRRSDGLSTGLQAIANEEAAKLGKSGVASQFGNLVRNWNKGGSYGTCLPNASGGCGTKVLIRSGTGLIGLPVKSGAGSTLYRTYAYGHLVSDVPVDCTGCLGATQAADAWAEAAREIFRDEIREALETW